MFSVGAKYSVNSTPQNQKNGLIAGKGAWITHVGPDAISLYFEQSGMHDLKVPRELFWQNFTLANNVVNKAYAKNTHAAKAFV